LAARETREVEVALMLWEEDERAWKEVAGPRKNL
jgi:hypothetical protein